MQQFEAEVRDISYRLPIELGGLSRSVSFDLSRDEMPELFFFRLVCIQKSIGRGTET